MKARKWNIRQRQQYQRPDGLWDAQKLAPTITALRAGGMTLPQVAEVTGIPLTTIRNAAKIEAIPERGILMVHLAAELKLSAAALRMHILYHDLPFTRFGQKMVLSDRTADQVRDSYRSKLPTNSDPNEWWTLKQVAALFGVAPTAMSQRLYRLPEGTVRHERVLANGNQHRYYAPDVRRLANQQPISLRRPPAGVMSVPELARLLNIRRVTLYQYAQDGAPCVAVRAGQLNRWYFRPEELAGWLLASSSPVRRSLGRTLLKAAQQERAA